MDSICINETQTDLTNYFINDGLAIYTHLRELFSDKKLYLLESASGPKRDCNMSLIGINPILNIKTTLDNTKIYANAELLQRIKNSFPELELMLSNEYLYKRHDDSSTQWEIYRSVTKFFKQAGISSDFFGLFGYFGYDTIHFVEKVSKLIDRNKNKPVIELSIYQAAIEFRKDGCAVLHEFDSSFWDSDDLSFLKNSGSIGNEEKELPLFRPNSIKKLTKHSTYIAAAEAALENIRAGDIYQIQLGHEIEIESRTDPFKVYQRMRHINPSPYMYYANMPETTLIGASPELFIQLSNSSVSMRPIAGTVGKKNGLSREDAVKELLESEKEVAEHVMLLDLCRNDIGRICKANTLVEDEIMIIEEFSHLYHMVSNVKATLSDSVDIFDAIVATFPAGTMTGAPKIRAMELIEQYESVDRGVYAGAIGLIGFNGTVNLALCIRSATYKGGVYKIRASAGIVADSEPEKEWDETHHKMGSVYLAITGEEISK